MIEVNKFQRKPEKEGRRMQDSTFNAQHGKDKKEKEKEVEGVT